MFLVFEGFRWGRGAGAEQARSCFELNVGTLEAMRASRFTVWSELPRHGLRGPIGIC